MASFNKVLLIGNLTRDPEKILTPGGQPITKFSLGVNRTYIDARQQKQTEVTFVDCAAFGKQAETLAKFLTKGKPLFVEGRLKLETWVKNGENRSRLTVVVEGFQFLDGGQRTDGPRTSGPTCAEDYHGTGD